MGGGFSKQIWATSVIYKKLPKVNNRPEDENSPNLVSLTSTAMRNTPAKIWSAASVIRALLEKIF
jgi:hypothetical protein